MGLRGTYLVDVGTGGITKEKFRKRMTPYPWPCTSGQEGRGEILGLDEREDLRGKRDGFESHGRSSHNHHQPTRAPRNTTCKCFLGIRRWRLHHSTRIPYRGCSERGEQEFLGLCLGRVGRPRSRPRPPPRPGIVAPQPRWPWQPKVQSATIADAANALGHSGNAHYPGPLGGGMSEVGY